MEIGKVKEAIQEGRVRITNHADDEAAVDSLLLDEIYFSVLHGEVIEDYPTDKPYPSCLIFGRTVRAEPVHSVWAYNEQTKWSVLVTVYRPDPKRWIDWTKRRNEK
jgi:hypothetical protein